MPNAPSHIDAATAAGRLQVSRATLYAYVSRGLIRTRAHPEDPRSRLYSATDIETLVVRKTRQRRPADAAAGTLDWGLPALDTHISQISGGQLSYRGVDAVDLSKTASFEDAAALLWGSDALSSARFAHRDVPGWIEEEERLAAADPVTRTLRLLPLLLDGEAPGLSASRLAQRGGELVRAIARSTVPGILDGKAIHLGLATAWNAPHAADAIRQALVLIADHEMNASTFAVRVAASTGATLTASLVAGLAALSGPKHGGAIARVRAFHDEVRRGADIAAGIRERLVRGDTAPGFGHPLYPDGDPRADVLLRNVHNSDILEFISAVEGETGLRASIDVAFHAFEIEYGLPIGAGLAIFATGRSAGWVAHAMEQRETGRLIRPRARFTAAEETL